MAQVHAWLPLSVLLLLATSTLVRLVGLRRDGVDAYALRKGDDAHAFLGRMFVAIGAAMLAFCVVNAFRPDLLSGSTLAWLDHPVLRSVGTAVAGMAVLLAVAAQFGMGRSWRVGVRDDDDAALVTAGLYRVSRNPIYVGMVGVTIGIFLIAPHAFTLAILVAAWIAVSAQIRLEEEFLARAHGAAFQDYCTRTRRWL